MSTQARGIMSVVLPKDRIEAFERYFDGESPEAFINTEVELTSAEDCANKKGYQCRDYDITCSVSLESCLIEPEDNDIRDVCYNLGLHYLDIEADNLEEIENPFTERIKFENGICSYSARELHGEDTNYDLHKKKEAEAY